MWTAMNWRRVTVLSEGQKDDLHGLYRNEWWTEDRDRADIDGLLENSDEVVAFSDAETERLVAFARVLTDYVYKAFVFDVIVDAEHRGAGLGDRVVESILDDPALASVEHVELYCLPDLVAFYERWGFDADLGDLRLLRLER